MPGAYFIVNIDGDPDPEDTPRNDAAVLEKYRLMQSLVSERAGGKGTICVHTSPMYRDRFFEEPFLDFWRGWVEGGGELTLHPEEDLYATPETRRPQGSHYQDMEHMRPILEAKLARMEEIGLRFTAYKGGYHGLTMNIAKALEELGILIDVTCAPGIAWPEKLAAWRDAPLSAYYMSREACGKAAAPGEKGPLFEIPFGWDGEPSDTSRRLLNRHYLVNEFSSYDELCRVWEAIRRRGETTGQPQIVGILCHTYSMQDRTRREQCGRVLEYMVASGGIPVTASEAKRVYDEGAQNSVDS